MRLLIIEKKDDVMFYSTLIMTLLMHQLFYFQVFIVITGSKIRLFSVLQMVDIVTGFIKRFYYFKKR